MCPASRLRPLVLPVLVLLTSLLPLSAAGQGGGLTEFAATGVLRDPAGAPVPCCDVLVVVRQPGTPDTFSQVLTRTRGDGSFRAEGLLCDPGLNLEVVAQPRCCSGESEPRDISGCLDPDTGGPLEELQLGDVICGDAPQTDRTLLFGRSVCRDGLFLEPVSDCGILARQDGTTPVAFTWTDDDGAWELCVDCNPAFPPVPWEVEAQCCELFETADTEDCPERREVDTFVCDPCPDPPCEEPREVQVSGRVVCPDPAGGPPTPIADCVVQLQAFDNCMSGPPPVEVVTDSDGNWTACLPCPLEEDCRLDTETWTVQAFPECCPNGVQVLTVEGCPPEVTMPDNACPPSPVGTECILEDACATGETRVSGQLICRDPLGAPLPIPDCTIVAQCPGGVPITAVTDSEGRYELCFPCDCDRASIIAECCDAQTVFDLTGCPREVVQDLECVNCPPPPRPCPPPDAVQVTGFVGCAQSGGVTPLAGCAVVLQPHDVTGMPLEPVTTVSEGDGRYTACVPCGDDGLALIQALSECCGTDTERMVDGCPETAEMDPLLCDDCSPCPSGMTRIQGRVHCRGAGGVAGCTVRIVVPTCDGPETYRSVTDSEGRYRLCVPCPCDGEVVTVVSECCDGRTRRLVEDCGPITPMRTIFCSTGCR